MADTKPGYLIRSTRPVVHLWSERPHPQHADALQSLCAKWRAGDDVDFNVGPSMPWCGKCRMYRGSRHQSRRETDG